MTINELIKTHITDRIKALAPDAKVEFQNLTSVRINGVIIHFSSDSDSVFTYVLGRTDLRTALRHVGALPPNTDDIVKSVWREAVPYGSFGTMWTLPNGSVVNVNTLAKCVNYYPSDEHSRTIAVPYTDLTKTLTALKSLLES